MLSVLRLTSVFKKLQLTDLTKFLIGKITAAERVALENAQQQNNGNCRSQQHRKFCSSSSSSSSDSNLHSKKSASAALASAAAGSSPVAAFGNCSTLSELTASARSAQKQQQLEKRTAVDRKSVENNPSDGSSGVCVQVKNMSTDQQQQHSEVEAIKVAAAATGSEPCPAASSPADIIKFLELVGSLKHIKRTGWVMRNVNDCETISGHMYRMGMMTYLLDERQGLDRTKCLELAMVHDLAECVVGDLTPFCGVSREEKKLRELRAMEDICKLIEPYGRKILELFQEYEAAESAESKFVKDLDRLDMVLQALEYEKRDNCILKHQEFFDSTDGKFDHPFVKKLVEEINTQRRELAAEKQLNGTSSLQQNGFTTNNHHIDDGESSQHNGHIDAVSDIPGEKKASTS